MKNIWYKSPLLHHSPYLPCVNGYVLVRHEFSKPQDGKYLFNFTSNIYFNNIRVSYFIVEKHE